MILGEVISFVECEEILSAVADTVVRHPVTWRHLEPFLAVVGELAGKYGPREPAALFRLLESARDERTRAALFHVMRSLNPPRGQEMPEGWRSRLAKRLEEAAAGVERDAPQLHADLLQAGHTLRYHEVLDAKERAAPAAADTTVAGLTLRMPLPRGVMVMNTPDGPALSVACWDEHGEPTGMGRLIPLKYPPDSEIAGPRFGNSRTATEWVEGEETSDPHVVDVKEVVGPDRPFRVWVRRKVQRGRFHNPTATVHQVVISALGMEFGGDLEHQSEHVAEEKADLIRSELRKRSRLITQEVVEAKVADALRDLVVQCHQMGGPGQTSIFTFTAETYHALAEAVDTAIIILQERASERSHRGRGIDQQVLLEDGLTHSSRSRVSFPSCTNCGGSGSVPGDRVPYGSTTAQLPDDPCDECQGLGIDLEKATDIRQTLDELRREAEREGAWELLDLDELLGAMGIGHLTRPTDPQAVMRDLILPRARILSRLADRARSNPVVTQELWTEARRILAQVAAMHWDTLPAYDNEGRKYAGRVAVRKTLTDGWDRLSGRARAFIASLDTPTIDMHWSTPKEPTPTEVVEISEDGGKTWQRQYPGIAAAPEGRWKQRQVRFAKVEEESHREWEAVGDDTVRTSHPEEESTDRVLRQMEKRREHMRDILQRAAMALQAQRQGEDIDNTEPLETQLRRAADGIGDTIDMASAAMDERKPTEGEE